ncbi:MATE family efflux transporter [Verticiella sediminum]|uniref:MATE family efflux transporter n=1 Tax=Verticiella sediminum TaxID=1247510 RepID=A0A556A7H3_9BURK|nr:MATE family efflux transporter [Verticiella sediminum]TSH88843.1 MATE family efflux transporter [Verticiella sediminum]
MSTSTQSDALQTPPSDADGLGRLARRLVGQAWPVMIGQWAGIAFGVLDTSMTGHASPEDLAAMALAVAINITVFVGLMGVVHALIPILAQRLGAGRLEDVGSGWGQGVWLALFLSAFGVAVLLFPDPLLALSGDIEPAVRTRIDGYLIALAFALPAALVFRAMYALGAAVSRPKVIMRIMLVGVALKAFFNWVLIFGKFGLPAFGAVGAGMATALVFWASVVLAGLVLRHDAYFRRFRLRLGRPRWADQRELLRLGLPMGASYLIEVMAFTFMALMVARSGIAATGAHQITANLAALCYMAPMALGIATSAQAAQALGAHQWDAARRLGQAGFLLIVGEVAITVAILLGAREHIVGFYTDSVDVAVLAVPLLVVLPLFHLADALHAMTLYLLRAYRIAIVPMLLQAVALGLVGLVGGWYLAYGPGAGGLAPVIARIAPDAPAGAAALWLMATTGLMLSCALMQPVYWRALRRTRGAAAAASTP